MDGEPGDLILRIRQMPHRVFERYILHFTSLQLNKPIFSYDSITLLKAWR